MQANKCDRCDKYEANGGYPVKEIRLPKPTPSGMPSDLFSTWSPRVCSDCWKEYQELFKPMYEKLLLWFRKEKTIP